MNRKKSSGILIYIIPLVLTSVFFVFMLLYSRALIDSDDAGELILAKLLSSEHSIISKKWFYSTEIRFLNTQLVFTPLFYISGSWRFVRCVGSTILLIIYELSAYYLGRAFGLDKRLSVLMAALVALPLSGPYFHYVMFGSYYIPHIAISFGVVALVICFCNEGMTIRGKLALCSALFLSFSACVEGPRQILCLAMPLLLAALVIREKKLLLASALCLISSGLGYMTNKILASVYTFSHMEGGFDIGFSVKNLVTVLKSYLTSYGFRLDRSLLSPFIICDLAALAVIALTVLATVHFIRRWSKLKTGERLVLTFFLSAMAVYTAFISLTGYSGSSRYNMQITIYALPLILKYLKDLTTADTTFPTESSQSGKQRVTSPVMNAVPVVSAVLLFLCCAFTYIEYVPDRKPSEHQLIAQAVESSGCSYIYSTFWNGNVLTELSDGRIEAHVWPYLIKGGEDSGVTNPDSVFTSLQEKNHETEHPSGSVCCVFDKKELSAYIPTCLEGSEIIYQSEDRTVYLLPSYEALRDLISK